MVTPGLANAQVDDLRQCFQDKRIILFDDELFAFYDDDEFEDKISVQQGKVLVYLSSFDVNTADTAHYEYAIPDDYSGDTHYFVFLDRDEDGTIDNRIYAYPKDQQFPVNLCNNEPKHLAHGCANLENKNPFGFEFTDTLNEGINWIYSQPKSNYTIQLYAALSTEEASKFIDNYQLQDRAVMFPAMVNDKTFFKIISGSYSTYNEARNYIRSADNNIQALDPWARKVAAFYPEISGLAITICP